MQQKLLGLLSVFIFSVFSMQAQEITGSWKGTLKLQATELPLTINVSVEDGTYISTLDSPAQGATDIPTEETTLEEGTFTMKAHKLGLKYVATVEGDKMSGTLYQAGMELPLDFEKFEKTLPGDPSLPSSEAELKELANWDKNTYKYQVEDFFAKPKARTFRFSPDGTYLSYREKDENGKNHIYVKHLKTNKVSRAIEETDELIRGYGWANEERLVFVKDKGGDENYHLFAVDLDGSDLKELTPFDGVRVEIMENLKDDKDHMIIGMNKNNPQIFEPYKININTGETEQLFTNDDAANPIMGYNFDKDGQLRGYTKLRDGVNMDFYYTVDGKSYDKMKELSWKDSFSIISFNYASEDPHDAYVISNLETDKAQVFLYNIKDGKVIKPIFSNDYFDVGGLSLSRNRNYELDYVSYEGEKQTIVPLSNYYKKLHQRITTEFPEYSYSIADVTDDESKYLIFIQSDKLYGTYYSYDAKTDTFEVLYDLMPHMESKDMAEMRPISFTSRDGKTIHGYITLPKAALNGEKVPLIVNPHGGPQGIRDSWGFNPETQLFASRGYATLQVNFRISGGYGREFLESGFKQIGRKAMDDVEDGVKYVIDQGWIDEDNVAIYGGSHGGYAVLRGLTKTPDLYSCGVDYVGVSNIFTFMNTIPAYWKPYLAIIKEIWYDESIPEEKAIMTEVSPVYNIDKIKKPLLVVQGANDPRVNIDESDQIVKALRAKGFDVPYLVKYDEGHGFGKEENQLELYRTMMGIYAKHFSDELEQPVKN